MKSRELGLGPADDPVSPESRPMTADELMQHEEQLRMDRVVYGNSFELRTADGRRMRLDPTKVAYPFPTEKKT